MTQLPLSTIPLSPLIRAALQEPSSLLHLEHARLSVDERLRTGMARPRLIELLRTGMRGLVMSDAQQRNLDRLADARCGIAISGQQIGALGGPFYTALKIASTVQAAREAEHVFGCQAVPIFWLEDNDHDAAEAATTWLATSKGVERHTHWDGQQERLRCADRVLTEHDIEHLHTMIATLSGKGSEAERARLEQIYVVGRSWSDAFLDILQPYLAAWGVLVVRASDVVQAGLHGPLVEHLLRKHEQVHAALMQTTQELIDRGFQAQVTIPDIPLMLRDEQGRHRIAYHDEHHTTVTAAGSVYTIDELVARASTHPEHFTPHAVSRPVIQDALFPTLVSVLGPGEIAYHAQLHGLYTEVGVSRPALLLRHMAIMIDQRTQRQMDHVHQDVAWFMRPWQEIEGEITRQLTDQIIPPLPTLGAEFEAWRRAANEIDPTLVGTVGAAERSVEATFEALSAKLRSARKKQEAQLVDRYRTAWLSIYPNATMSDRMYPLAHWTSRFGMEDLLEHLAEIAAGSRNQIAIRRAS